MRRPIGIGIVALAGACAALPVVGAPAKPSAKPAGAVRAEIRSSAAKGIAYLRGAQDKEGSWQHYPGITAICVYGLLRSGLKVTDPTVARACEYLAGLAKSDGAIYTDALGPSQTLPTYNTALSLLALNAARKPGYAAVIKKAQEFLSGSQYDEGEGFKQSNTQYGGFGYGNRRSSGDLSNTQTALEALRDSATPKDAEVFKKALIFLQRCQNRSESNDQAWVRSAGAPSDGGFIYSSNGDSKADEYTKQAHSTYGSMTYAGLKSYLYCSVTRADPRVQAAWNWVRANYEVNQNPRMGDDGLYYYYHTMSKTLAVWGRKDVVDAAGNAHPWASDLSAAIISRQRPDGAWENKNPRWWENRAELATGYSLVSLANCRQGL